MAKHKKKSSHHDDSIRALKKKHKHSKKKKKRTQNRKKKDCAECQIAKFRELCRYSPEDSGSSSDEVTILFDSRTVELNDVQLIVGRNETVSSDGTSVKNEIAGPSNGPERESVIKLVGKTSESVADKNQKLDPKLLQECLLRIVGSELKRRDSIEIVELEPTTPPVEITISDDTLDSIPLPGEQPRDSDFEKVSSIPLPNDISVAEISSTVVNETDQANVDSKQSLTEVIEIDLNKAEYISPSTSPVSTNQRPGTSCPVEICPKSKHKRKRVESSQNPITRRIWQYTTMGNAMTSEGPLVTNHKQLIFDVLSYNVLSQSIMEDHPDLYQAHNPQALDWNYRSKLLMQELKNFNADILCLQEVQHSHLKPFYSKLNDLGYSGIYKQRTGNKVDGVAIYFKNSVFNLTDYTTVEFYQPGIEVLNRDNVALVAKLAPKVKPQEQIVVATTHLLFNPRRHDVKLAQTQLLLAEVERFAFRAYDASTGETSYWPVILTGDLNLEPHSGVFELLTTGSFQYEGMGHKSLTPGYGRNLSKHLLPEDLDISDSCQHRTLVSQRQIKPLDPESEKKFLKIYNSDYPTSSNSVCEAKTAPPWAVTITETTKSNVCLPQPHLWFGSGRLSHPLNLKSAYVHDPDKWYDNSQVTTYQGRWVLVDYIFYSCQWERYMQHRAKDTLRLVARYRLYNEDQASELGPIPNLTSPSDHYPLCVKFAWLLH